MWALYFVAVVLASEARKVLNSIYELLISLHTTPKIRSKVYGGPICRAMCRLPRDDVHAMIDDVDMTIGSVMNFIFSKFLFRIWF